MAGALAGSFFIQRFGRKKGVIVMSLWALMTAIIMATAQNKWQVLFGRVLNYCKRQLSLVHHSGH